MKNVTKYVISFSAEIPELRNNKLFIPDIARGYPGASWPSELNKILTNSQFCCVTADIALEMLSNKIIKPERILVIQHNMDPLSKKLIELGSIPFLITIFESPLYAPNFYNSLNKLEQIFYYSLVFCDLKDENSKRSAVRFPSFFKNNSTIQNQQPWKDRKFSCMVVGNKYVPLQTFKDTNNISEFSWLLIMRLKRLLRPKNESLPTSLRDAQLQDKRIEAIIYFTNKSLLDLYGRKWNTLWLTPPKFRSNLKKAIGNKDISTASDKIQVLRSYKFNFCFENISHPGYITEKIFDALIAETIPVYWGPKNIHQFIPANIFIDASRFSCFDELLVHMEKITESEAELMIQQGKKFLQSTPGASFSYEANAIQIAQKIQSFLSIT